jgi:hypothetical protein
MAFMIGFLALNRGGIARGPGLTARASGQSRDKATVE